LIYPLPLFVNLTAQKPLFTLQIFKKVDGLFSRKKNKSVPFSLWDLQGIVPSNKKIPNGKQAGRTQSEYNEVTHSNKGP
jgi:hypothetical protein